jgi:hypothetical protein
VSFPDVEAELVSLLEPYGTVKTYTDTDLQDVIADGTKYIVVQAGGGQQDRLQWKPGVQIAVYGKDRGALATAEDICEYLTMSVSRHYPFDRISVQTPPQETPWPSDGVRLWTSTYTAVVRRQD